MSIMNFLNKCWKIIINEDDLSVRKRKNKNLEKRRNMAECPIYFDETMIKYHLENTNNQKDMFSQKHIAKIIMDQEKDLFIKNQMIDRYYNHIYDFSDLRPERYYEK